MVSIKKPAARPAKKPTTVRKRKLREAARGQARDVFRVAILEAAERVFARRGFNESKVANIAKEAGLAAGTLYNYFDSKEAIFQSICELRGSEILAQSRRIAASDASPLQRIKAQIEWFFGHLDGHADSFQMFVQLRSTAEWEMKHIHGEAALANYLEHLALLEKLMAQAQEAGELRADVPAADLATALAGMTNGFIHGWLLSKPRARISAHAPLIFDLFCKGAVRR